jgi:phosphohistidine phosphatase
MRHAKAEPFAENDRARRLTDRGVAAARDVGAHLLGVGIRPDFAVVSPAARTRATWEAVLESTGDPAHGVSFDDAVYTGGPDVVLEAVQAAPAEAGTVVFVGHNPTAAYLCHLLDDGEGDPSAVSRLLEGFPPGAMAVMEIGVPWADLAAETGRVVGYYVGQA